MLFRKNGDQSPDIVVTFNFVTATSTGSYSRYADYTNREEAVQEQWAEQAFEEHFEKKDFQKMMGYMDRSQAVVLNESRSGLFNQDSPNMTQEELVDLKFKLETAQEKGNNLWNSAISFDLHFLIKNGILKEDPILEDQIARADQLKKQAEGEVPKNGKKIYEAKKDLEKLAKQREVDQEKLKAAVQSQMPKFIKSEGFSKDAFWWGSVHMNTKHIHIHVSVSEETNSRERMKQEETGLLEPKGKLKERPIHRLKANLAHELVLKKTKQERLSREKEVGQRKETVLKGLTAFSGQRDRSNLEHFYFQKVSETLPETTKGYYHSNHPDFKETKIYLHALTHELMQGSMREGGLELKEALTQQFSTSEYSFSEGEKETIVNKRMAEFEKTLGNALLKEARAEPRMKEEKITPEHLSSTELGQVINHLKRTDLSKKTLGEYRYCLKQSEAVDREVILSKKVWALDHNTEVFNGEGGNETLIQLKSKELWAKVYEARQILEQGRTTESRSGFTNTQEKNHFEEALDPRDLSIKQALEPFVQEKLKSYQQQIELLSAYKITEDQSQHFLERFYDAKTPQEAIEKLNTQKDILETKQKIQENNLSDQRQANRPLFEHLKHVYAQQEATKEPERSQRKGETVPQKENSPERREQRGSVQHKVNRNWKQSIDRLLSAASGQVMDEQRAQRIMAKSDNEEKEKERRQQR